MKIETVILDERLKGELLPQYHSPGAAAIDLRACIDFAWGIDPGCRMTFGVGFAIHISDPAYAGIIIARSGLGSKGLILANGSGLIDSDYQGELKINLWNSHPDNKFEIKPMDRIAQLLIVPVRRIELELVEKFSNKTQRAEGGFGSTGFK